MDWIIENKDWLFNGLLVTVPIAIIGWFFYKGNRQTQKGGDNSTNIQAGKNINITQHNDHE
ncbi:MAG: hypothetical protein AB2810_19105 [Candidatus Thiodiazotropha endolucinida]